MKRIHVVKIIFYVLITIFLGSFFFLIQKLFKENQLLIFIISGTGLALMITLRFIKPKDILKALD